MNELQKDEQFREAQNYLHQPFTLKEYNENLKKNVAVTYTFTNFGATAEGEGNNIVYRTFAEYTDTNGKMYMKNLAAVLMRFKGN